MGHRSTAAAVSDLERHGKLLRVDAELDPNLEIAEVHRRVCANQGPAILFTNVKGCQFPVASNLFGTIQRARFLFRDTLENIQRLVELKIDPSAALRSPLRYLHAPWYAWSMMPKHVRSGAVLKNETQISRLPQIICWPRDGGPFVTLPQVYTESTDRPGVTHSNLGMYRIQLAGNEYTTDREIGLHYQIHRGIGVHHQEAIRAGKPFRVNIFVGGAPAMSLAAVMPLPEGMSELGFAGALAGRRIPLVRRGESLPIYGDADFCITGIVDPSKMLPEGPFGDHLGYYSLKHPFPLLKVEKVYHRDGAIWPFTVVGRPPQEDTIFGQLIHEISGPAIPTVIPGVKAVHAVDAAGVHPLLLAIGSERYMPFLDRPAPQELLTQSHAILGQGQLSLAKYLLIVSNNDAPQLDIHDIEAFFSHLLSRIDFSRDIHFHTCTTIDTLDYSGSGLNAGSKVVMAAVGPTRRLLLNEIPPDLALPEVCREAKICLPGILAVSSPKHRSFDRADDEFAKQFARFASSQSWPDGIPLVVFVDDADFTSQTLNNFLWVTFTRSNPAADIYGANSTTHQKHWGCQSLLIVDARMKAHHAPPLEVDAKTASRIDALAASGGPLAKFL
jgi:4-hydroxy-3-polyprenylbenzoate decarboxylase